MIETRQYLGRYFIDCWDFASKMLEQELNIDRLQPIKRAQPGDLLWFDLSSGPHVGVYCGDHNMVHYTPRGVKVEDLRRNPWKTLTIQAYRLI